MKKLFYLLLVALGATMLTACSDDDDKDNSPEGPGEVEKVDILEKKIKKVTEYEDVEDFGNLENASVSAVYEYGYDEEGRIKSCNDGYYEDSYAYLGDKITIESKGKYGDKREFIFTLENGRITKYSWEEEDDKEDYVLKYAGNYLSEAVMTSDEDSETETFSFDGGKLTKYTYDGGDGYKGSAEFTYDNQLNNLNIDLFYIMGDYCFDGNVDDVFQFDEGGTRSAYLPSSIKYTEPKWDEDEENIIGSETYTMKVTYEMTGEYITKVILENKDEDGELYYDVWVIEYEN